VAESNQPSDLELIDLIDAIVPTEFSGAAWRVLPGNRNPLQGHPSHGRWDPGKFNVLYTSLAREGAIAEIHFRYIQEPVRPSKIAFNLYELEIGKISTLKLVDINQLIALGVDIESYQNAKYDRTRKIAQIANQIGYDGIIAPNARWDCNNLILFTDRLAPDALVAKTPQQIDLAKWKVKQRKMK
jgi:hypothetical protein